jgi:glycosyltransferase involved in cell wall biosynthesis
MTGIEAINTRQAVAGKRPGDISVVIPYFNREQYIDEAVQSALGQTLKPMEVIIVNDCSTESSRRWLDRYAETCIIVDLPASRGAAEARNEGIRRARGQFIAFLDDDDIWLPQKLQVQRQYIQDHPECDLVHSGVWSFFSGKPDVLCACDWPPPLSLAQALTHNHWVFLQTIMIRTSVIRSLGGFDGRFRGSEDHDLVIRCCATGHRVEGIAQPLVRYRCQGQASLTRKYWQMYLTAIQLVWKHRKLYYRIYGVRGMASFLMATLEIAVGRAELYSKPTLASRCVGKFVRVLLRLVKVKYRIKPDWRRGAENTLTS